MTGLQRSHAELRAMILALGVTLLFGFAASGNAQTHGEAQPVPQPDGSGDSVPAWLIPTADLNRRLPSWLRFDGEYRSRAERFGGISFKSKDDNHDLSRLRVKVTIQPTRWLGFVGEMQDSRVFLNQNVPSTPPYQNTFDIRQAYVQLGSASSGWFDIVGGRQNLTFGDERLIGPSDWLNMGRTFDLVRLDLRHSWFRLSLFASSVIVARDGVIDHHYEGNNLHGAYGSLSRVVPHATLEPYVLWRVAPATLRLNENAGRGALSEVTVGARIEGKAPGLLEYTVEMDRQAGSLGPDSIDSWAGHWNVAKPLNVRLQPRPFVDANYASGTKDPAGRTWSTFDQLYPSNHNKLGFADQVGWRNIEQVRAGISETVGRKWKFTETYEDFWLASARDALYSSSGAPVAQSATGSAGRRVGQEVDAWAEWNWKEALQLGFGYARFLTGPFLNRTTPGKDYNYPFVYMTYRFTQGK
jgi:hypothetical protein